LFKPVLAAAALALTLAACASAPNPLDLQSRQALFVKDVATGWTYDDSKKADDEHYQAYKKDALPRLTAAVTQAFATSPAGSTAVTFKIDVKTFDASRLGARIIGDVHVVRNADGKEVGLYKDVVGFQTSNGGLLGLALQAVVKPDVVGIAANSFAQNLRARFDAKS
jgi:uncharacterized lipoprotein YmbA